MVAVRMAARVNAKVLDITKDWEVAHHLFRVGLRLVNEIHSGESLLGEQCAPASAFPPHKQGEHLAALQHLQRNSL